MPMPTVYLVEMCMDRIAACKTYHGKNYTESDPINYLKRAMESPLMHPETMRKTQYLLQMLADRGEQETFRYIREHVLRGEDFAQQTE